MTAWRIVGTVACLALVAAARAETYPLNETVQSGDCFAVRLEMKLAGQMKVLRNGEATSLKLEATATHEFPERVLAVGASGLPEKVARHYDAAKAVITVADSRSERTLRADRRLCVAQRYKDQPLLYCPAASLTRDELDLTSDHFDTLCVTGLLPPKAVAVGDTWTVPNVVVQALCNFEGLSKHGLSGKLDEVKGTTATFSVTGTAEGIDHGAMVKVNVSAKGTFDLSAKRLVGLEWTQKDEREQGPVSPTASVETTTKLTRKPVEQPEALSDVKLVSVPDSFTPPGPMVQLEHRDADGRFEMLYAREWQLVGQTKERTVLRLMDRGDFLAQATVTPWTEADKGKHMSAEDFKKAMNATPDWEPERELQSGEVPSDREGRWTYRFSVIGKMDGVEVLQNFYLIAGPGGEQVVVVFTMTPKQADKFGVRDLALVGAIEVPAAKK
jgi:hypothetical protein